MHFVYVLRSRKDEKFYIGYTASLDRRLLEHHIGQCYTTQRLENPELIFYEAFLSEDDARRRENYFKTTQGKKGLRLILRESLLKIS